MNNFHYDNLYLKDNLLSYVILASALIIPWILFQLRVLLNLYKGYRP